MARQSVSTVPLAALIPTTSRQNVHYVLEANSRSPTHPSAVQTVQLVSIVTVKGLVWSVSRVLLVTISQKLVRQAVYNALLVAFLVQMALMHVMLVEHQRFLTTFDPLVK